MDENTKKSNDENKEENISKAKKRASQDLVGRTIKPVPNNQSPNLDVDVSKLFPDTIILAGQENKLNTSEIEKFTTISNNRGLQYSQIDSMFLDSSVSAISRTIIENVCIQNEDGHLMWADSMDPWISKYINYVLHRMKVDKNLPKWTGCLVKYGDVYLKLLRESDFEDKLFSRSDLDKKYAARKHLNEAIDLEEDKKLKDALEESIKLVLHRDSDSYNFHLEMVPDPSTMFELTSHDVSRGFIEVPNDLSILSTNDMLGLSAQNGSLLNANSGSYNYQIKTGEIRLYQAEDFVHGCLDEGHNRFPETVNIVEDDSEDKSGSNGITYGVRRGKSMFYDAYKIWREKSLIESSLLLARLTKSSVFKLVKLETGNTDKTKSSQLLHQVKDMFEQKRAVTTDGFMENYNNPGPMENWIYFNVRQNVGAISVETVGGDYDPKQLTDLDWWNNKYYGAFGIPKQYFGWTEDGAGFNGGSALTVISSVFKNKVINVQNALIQMITSALELYCWQAGLTGYIGNFTIKMKRPLSQEEISARENFTNKINEISSSLALFTDVETKSNRLKLLKGFMNKLEGGPEITAILDDEIKRALEAEEKAKAAEEAEEAAKANGDEADLDLGGGDEGELDLSMDDSSSGGDTDLGGLDLADIPPAPDTPAQESFSHNSALEQLNEDIEFLDESTELPTLDEIGIDFTENN